MGNVVYLWNSGFTKFGHQYLQRCWGSFRVRERKMLLCLSAYERAVYKQAKKAKLRKALKIVDGGKDGGENV